MLLPQLFLQTIFGMPPTVPNFLLMTIFAMPVLIAVTTAMGACAERRSVY